MNRFLLFSLAVLSLLLTGPLAAQDLQLNLTTQGPLPAAGVDDTLFVDEAYPLTAPALGQDMLWDYSNASRENFFVANFVDVQDDPAVPRSELQFTSSFGFAPFVTLTKSFLGSSEEGVEYTGVIVPEISFPITPLTGGPDDMLTYPDDTLLYDDNYLIKYPLRYDNPHTSSTVELSRFELTVAGFGLNGTPGFREEVSTSVSELVGDGQLVMPGGRDTIDAYLVRNTYVSVDSFFVGGAVAPDVLVNAFGFTQGQVRTIVRYDFFTPGVPLHFVRIGTDFRFRPTRSNFLNATNDYNLLDFSVSPNPVPTGQELRFATASPLVNGTVSLVDLNGRVVQSVPFAARGSNQFSVTVSADLPAGLYVYRIASGQGLPLGSGKVMIR